MNKLQLTEQVLNLLQNESKETMVSKVWNHVMFCGETKATNFVELLLNNDLKKASSKFNKQELEELIEILELDIKETELKSIIETLENKFNTEGEIDCVDQEKEINEYFIQINGYNFSFHHDYENTYYYLYVSYEYNCHFKNIIERLSSFKVLKSTINRILEKGF